GTDDVGDLLVHHRPGDVGVPHGCTDAHHLTSGYECETELTERTHRFGGTGVGRRIGTFRTCRLGAVDDLTAPLKAELTAGGEVMLHTPDGDACRLGDGTERHPVDPFEIDDLPQGMDDLGAALGMVDDLRHPPTVRYVQRAALLQYECTAIGR